MPTPPFEDPLTWFDAWFADASQTIEIDPNAVTLATVGADGRPAARVVLLKEWDARGFVFYTNRRSRKGRHLAENPQAALNFFWRRPKRQIRIEGIVELVADEQSDAYFASRPRGSKLGAWASLQSEELDSRETLADRTREFDEKYAGRDVPRPDHWGGYRLKPELYEFWASGDHRLHDRWEFRGGDDEWDVRRLYP